MPGIMPKRMTFAVEKMTAGGKPSALVKSVRRKAKRSAPSPNERMYSTVVGMSPLASSVKSSGKKVGAIR